MMLEPFVDSDHLAGASSSNRHLLLILVSPCLQNLSNLVMPASVKRLISQSCEGSRRFAIARGIRRQPYAVPALVLAKRQGFDARPCFARSLHSALSSQEQVRVHNSVHKETLRREITDTSISGGDITGQKQFADYDLAGGVFVVTGGAQGLGLSMAEALADAGGKGEHRYISTSTTRASHKWGTRHC